MKARPIFNLLIAVVFAAAGCAKKETSANAGRDQTVHQHEHKAPHGGTPVVLGNEAYHLELVLDAVAGKISAYVLDGEMENFIRTSAPAFEVTATVGGAKQTLVFKAIADAATGETMGDTALFETQADWLKTTPAFDAVLTKIEIRGTAFSDVAFNFPRGNDKD